MNVLKKYNVVYENIRDILIVFSPTTEEEKNEMFKFRYHKYLDHDYISKNTSGLDNDEYDNDGTIYINVFSKNQSRIIGTVRIIFSKPLPILKDCFNFKEPFFACIIGEKNKAEIGRLIIDKYSQKESLPRHFIMMIIIREVLSVTKKMNIRLVYSFIKLSLFLKLKKIYFPFFVIRNYQEKYTHGILIKYFEQKENPVIPVYFIRWMVNIYIFFALVKFKRYICS